MSERAIKVYGLGNAIVDLQVAVTEAELLELGLAKGGMRLVEIAEQEQLLQMFASKELKKSSGGSAANTIIALAQLGSKTAYSCLVAEDDFGSYYLQEMKELGVVMPNLAIPRHSSDLNLATGTSVILITPDAERTMNTHLGVSALLSAKDLSEELIAQSEWLYLEGYLFSSDSGFEAMCRAVKIAKANQVKIAVTCSDTFVVDFFKERLLHILESTDLIFANKIEGASLTSANEEDEIFDKLCMQVPNVALTLSEKGALVRYEKEHARINGFAVDSIDATGAGDMFAGGFLHGITSGLGVEESGKLACFLASRVVAQYGARLPQNITKEAGMLLSVGF
jgi:sugar/nucleoside kinase (ribokinase family)